MVVAVDVVVAEEPEMGVVGTVDDLGVGITEKVVDNSWGE